MITSIMLTGEASKWPSFSGISDFAKYDESGTSLSLFNPSFPFQLIFEPNVALTKQYSDSYKEDYMTYIQRDITAGTMLYTILALDSPTATSPIAIGSIVTTSDFTTSKYADTTLQFKHTSFEKDLSYYPSWTKSCASVTTCKVCPVDVSCYNAAAATDIPPGASSSDHSSFRSSTTTTTTASR